MAGTWLRTTKSCRFSWFLTELGTNVDSAVASEPHAQEDFNWDGKAGTLRGPVVLDSVQVRRRPTWQLREASFFQEYISIDCIDLI